ncbi:MAG: T9SS type A sorting domain-containing protein [candidate division Zixibacteria bacterium]|nr:T9SS type A sorting domain-containing protein [candidate division Zixibacteria bacterium]
MARYNINTRIVLSLLLIIITGFSQLYAHPIEIDNLDLMVSFNGKFIKDHDNVNAGAFSDNGRFRCEYEVGRVTDEVRELKNFKMYEDDRLLYSLETVPGADLYISNSGIAAFLDHTHHYRGELTIHFYSQGGQSLFSEKYNSANLFGFSSSGNRFGVGTPKSLQVISLSDQRIDTYDRGFQFDISEDDQLVAVAMENLVKVYDKNALRHEIHTGFAHTRKVKISSERQIIAAIDKRHLKVFSLMDGQLVFADSLTGNLSYRDIELKGGLIQAGIQFRDKEVSKGVLRIYDDHGKIIHEGGQSTRNITTSARPETPEGIITDYDPIPWPYPPFDSICTVWNYYEQHMGIWNQGWSYLHQGLDLITAIDEPTHAVETGIVKCVLTLGGDHYWRLAISPEQSSGTSTGWLYAHLVESSIAVDVGDTVEIYDYLADIIEWSNNWGHIHFVQIRDSGLIWYYEDDEWGIVYNPLLSLEPDTDTLPPVIEQIFDESKFAFCLNETSEYLSPDSLYGDIDIIVQVRDHMPNSPLDLPAYETYYWIENLPERDTIVSRTLGQVLNHSYDFYSSDSYDPYAPLIYKRDDILVPSHWEEVERNFYHVLTNNNGDSLAILGEEDLAFQTANYPDGHYCIWVEVKDEFGNAATDGMVVQFRNDPTDISETDVNTPDDFHLFPNYPNPFNQSTVIRYNLPLTLPVKISIYDLLGREVDNLVDENQVAGHYQITWNATGQPSGIYFYRIDSGDFNKTRKMFLLK